MRTTIVLIGAATMLGIGSLTAQGPTSASTVAIGCINRAAQTGSVGGSAGVPPATPATAEVLANSSDVVNTFLLNAATPPDATEEARARAAAGEPPTELQTAYVLDGKPQDFEGHLGHRVEVTGTLLAPNDGGPAAAKSNVKHIRVTAIRMLSTTCPMGSTEATNSGPRE